MSEEVNPFMVKDDSGHYMADELDLMAVSQQKRISEIGAPSTISELMSDSGMMLLPFGMERGVDKVRSFVWKDKREAAAAEFAYKLRMVFFLYMLRVFGEPQKLRPGDSICHSRKRTGIIFARHHFP